MKMHVTQSLFSKPVLGLFKMTELLMFLFRRATSYTDLPMAMRFRHLKGTAKEAVGVYRYVKRLCIDRVIICHLSITIIIRSAIQGDSKNS